MEYFAKIVNTPEYATVTCFANLSNISKKQLGASFQAWQQYAMKGRNVDLQIGIHPKAVNYFRKNASS